MPSHRSALSIMAAAFENRIGTTHGVGDGMRAALDALVEEARDGDEWVSYPDMCSRIGALVMKGRSR